MFSSCCRTRTASRRSRSRSRRRFLCFGLLMTSPTTAQIGVPLALFTSTSMALQQPFSADAEGFINSGLATILGMGFTVAATALIRPAGALWRANRFMRANELALAEAAEVHSANDEARVMGLMFDRLALLAPIAHAIDHRMPDALRQLRAGFNILEAHQARGRMSPSARRGLDALLTRLARHYRQGAAPPTGKILRRNSWRVAHCRPRRRRARPCSRSRA